MAARLGELSRASFDPALPVGIAPLLAAGAAVVVSARSHVVSRRALRLAEAQAARERPRVTPYLYDSSWLTLPGEGGRLLQFSISLANVGDAAATIVRAELLVHCMLNARAELLVRLEHKPGLARLVGAPSGAALVLPLRIGAHESCSGWLFFALEERRLEDGTIEEYEVRFTGTDGVTASVRPAVVRPLDPDRAPDPPAA